MKKLKCFSFLATFLLSALFSMVWAWEGSGTEEAPYQIATSADLDQLASDVNKGEIYEGKYFKLTADIEYNSTIENNFTPIGFDDYYWFSGQFDGNGKTIRGIRINAPNDRYVGLFRGVVSDSKIENVRIADAVIVGNSLVGGIAGFSNGLIKDCTVDSVLIKSFIVEGADESVSFGGIVGSNQGTISGCTSFATIKGDGSAYGGIAGYNIGSVENCTSRATIEGNGTEYGGIVGKHYLNAISGCTSSATIKGNGSKYGGIVGYGGNISMSNNFVIGATISADSYFGAVAGLNNSSLSNNFYTACTIGGNENATDVGVGYESSKEFPHDVTIDNGAVYTDYFTIGAAGSLNQKVDQGKMISTIFVDYKDLSIVTCEGLPEDLGCEVFDESHRVFIVGSVSTKILPGDYNYKIVGKTSDNKVLELPGTITVQKVAGIAQIERTPDTPESQAVIAGNEIPPLKFRYLDATGFKLEKFPSGNFEYSSDGQIVTVTGTIAADIAAGTIQVEVIAIGSKKNDTASVDFVVSKSLTNEEIEVSAIPDQLWKASGSCPKADEIKVTDYEKELVSGLEYDVECSNNMATGTAIMTITGKGSYYDEINTSFEIIPRVLAASGSVRILEDEKGSRVEVGDGDEAPVEFTDTYKVNAVDFQRPIESGVAVTTMLPFRLPKGTTYNATFYKLYNVRQVGCGWVASMQPLSKNKVPENNVPYVVRLDDGATKLEFNLNNGLAEVYTDFIDETVYEKEAVESENWLLKGLYQYKVWNEGNEELDLAYAFAGSNEKGIAKGQFGKIKAGAYAYPMRAYLLKASSDVKLDRSACSQQARAYGPAYSLGSDYTETIQVEFLDENKQTTGIGRLDPVTGNIKIERWYDLKGRKVNNVNRAAKGAYYGKKVLAK